MTELNKVAQSILNDYEDAQSKAKAVERHTGAYNKVMEDLKNEFGVSSLDEAVELLGRFEQDIKKKSLRLDRQRNELSNLVKDNCKGELP